MHDCIFCKIASGQIPSAKVWENEKTFVFLDTNPANPYHALAIPKAHFRDIFEIPAEELQEVALAVKEVAALYRTKLGIENLQIFNNSGPEAQQNVFHLHFHILPRSAGDGQDVVRAHHPELREQFAKMLEKLA